LYWFFFSSRRLHTRWPRDWSSDVCSPIFGAGRNWPNGLVEPDVFGFQPGDHWRRRWNDRWIPQRITTLRRHRDFAGGRNLPARNGMDDSTVAGSTLRLRMARGAGGKLRAARG